MSHSHTCYRYTTSTIKKKNPGARLIALNREMAPPTGFEPVLPDRQSGVLGRYTMEAFKWYRARDSNPHGQATGF